MNICLPASLKLDAELLGIRNYIFLICVSRPTVKVGSLFAQMSVFVAKAQDPGLGMRLTLPLDMESYMCISGMKT